MSRRGLCVTIDPAEGLTVLAATHTVTDDTGQVSAAIFGPLSSFEARLLAARLEQDNDAGAAYGDLPWAIVMRRRGGEFVWAASTMLPGGLLTRFTAPQSWSVATDLKALVATGEHSTPLDWSYLRDSLVARAPIDRTPVMGVGRIPGGQTAVWGGGDRVVQHPWCSPDTLPTPTRDDPQLLDDYLAAFDAVVRGLITRTDPVVTTLSGGLDSTFLAASLVRARPSTPILALCHSPEPGIEVTHHRGWDADDFTHAEHMAAAYPGAIRLCAVRNSARVHPLDAASAWVERQWWPSAAPANVVWMSQVADIADDVGASLRFFGTQGNASYSGFHPYAFGYHLRRGQVRRAWRMASESGVRRQFATLNRRPMDVKARWSRFGIDRDITPRPPESRLTWERWVTGRLRASMSTQNPAGADNLYVDPFTARSMIEMAASISASVWQRGYPSRALARRLALGRVPDTLRLRRTRGAQAFDAIGVMREQPERLLDPIMSRWPAWDELGVDTARLARVAREMLAPRSHVQQTDVQAILRIVATAEYVAALGGLSSRR